MQMQIRIRFEHCGGHVHCRLFMSHGDGSTFAKRGDLTFSAEEWPSVRSALPAVQFVNDRTPNVKEGTNQHE